MASDWITIAQAAETLGKTEAEVRALLEEDGVETLSAGDVSGEIALAPREYVERKREELSRAAKRGKPGSRRRRRTKSDKPADPEPIEVEEIDEEDAADPKLRQVVTDRYQAVVEAIKKSERSEALDANLVRIREAFELTSEAIHRMREAHAETTASIERSLQLQNQLMQNLLTALQSADQNTSAVLQYQHDFIDAIRRLPEPLQSIQDVQLGLIELEEQRQNLEKERVRFEETDLGRLATLLVYVLLIVALVGMVSIGWTVLQQMPDLIQALRSVPR